MHTTQKPIKISMFADNTVWFDDKNNLIESQVLKSEIKLSHR